MDSQLNPFTDLKEKAHKPVMAVITGSSTAESAEVALDLMGRLQGMGIPAFSGMERGARALRNAVEYYRMKNS